MPKDRPFIDKHANIGRPYLAPNANLEVQVQPQSRSLNELSKFDAESRKIKAEIKRGTLRLDLQYVIGDKIIIKRKDAIQFANWIITSL